MTPHKTRDLHKTQNTIQIIHTTVPTTILLHLCQQSLNMQTYWTKNKLEDRSQKKKDNVFA